MNLPARPKADPINRPGMTRWIRCSKCGMSSVVASGFNALAITPAQEREAAKCLGWKVAPRYECLICWCPMSHEDRTEARRLLDAVVTGGNCMDDIKDLESFIGDNNEMWRWLEVDLAERKKMGRPIQL